LKEGSVLNRPCLDDCPTGDPGFYDTDANSMSRMEIPTRMREAGISGLQRAELVVKRAAVI
jgi:hypothetical protein